MNSIISADAPNITPPTKGHAEIAGLALGLEGEIAQRVEVSAAGQGAVELGQLLPGPVEEILTHEFDHFGGRAENYAADHRLFTCHCLSAVRKGWPWPTLRLIG